LVNKLGISRKREIDQAEFEALLAAQSRHLSIIGTRTRFSSALLRRMHKDWLGSIYSWAGEYRTVNLTKGGFTWPSASRVAENMFNFERELLTEHTPCTPGPISQVAKRMAVVHAEFLLIHPFRDGNGRLARWLADLMALQAKFPPPHYRFTGRGGRARRDRYLNAVQAGYLQDYGALTDFFAEALDRIVTRGA
jgi:cell filamentation protein